MSTLRSGTLAVGSLRAMAVAAGARIRGERSEVCEQVRLPVGQVIHLGIEVLISADVVQMVTIDPTIESAATLGLIVLVRTFLSFSLEIELEGAAPWRRREATREDGIEDRAAPA